MTEIVYVLGSTRSGTSALRNAIAATRFSGYGEGHLVPMLQDVINCVRNQKSSGLGHDVQGTGLSDLRPNVMLRHFFHAYERYLSSQFKNESILDKTPTVVPIEMAPQLNQFHNSAKFIFCSRRHVDNIASKVKKFPEQTLEQHCREWSGCNGTWLDVKAQLDGNFLEIEYYDLANSPGDISNQIGRYLSLDLEDIAALKKTLTFGRPETSADRDVTDFLRLSELGWSSLEQSTVKELCQDTGTKFGYAFETYFADAARA